jgi:hypothetical protein
LVARVTAERGELGAMQRTRSAHVRQLRRGARPPRRSANADAVELLTNVSTDQPRAKDARGAAVDGSVLDHTASDIVRAVWRRVSFAVGLLPIVAFWDRSASLSKRRASGAVRLA